LLLYFTVFRIEHFYRSWTVSGTLDPWSRILCSESPLKQQHYFERPSIFVQLGPQIVFNLFFIYFLGIVLVFMENLATLTKLCRYLIQIFVKLRADPLPDGQRFLDLDSDYWSLVQLTNWCFIVCYRQLFFCFVQGRFYEVYGREMFVVEEVELTQIMQGWFEYNTYYSVWVTYVCFLIKNTLGVKHINLIRYCTCKNY